jgi:hypothetical protein
MHEEGEDRRIEWERGEGLISLIRESIGFNLDDGVVRNRFRRKMGVDGC